MPFFRYELGPFSSSFKRWPVWGTTKGCHCASSFRSGTDDHIDTGHTKVFDRFVSWRGVIRDPPYFFIEFAYRCSKWSAVDRAHGRKHTIQAFPFWRYRFENMPKASIHQILFYTHSLIYTPYRICCFSFVGFNLKYHRNQRSTDHPSVRDQEKLVEGQNMPLGFPRRGYPSRLF